MGAIANDLLSMNIVDREIPSMKDPMENNKTEETHRRTLLCGEKSDRCVAKRIPPIYKQGGFSDAPKPEFRKKNKKKQHF